MDSIKRPMSVSLVIVNWKTADDLLNCLASITRLDKNSNQFEIIVVDNNSGDDSVKKIRRQYKTIQIIENTQNLGFSKACNQGIRRASGKFVLLLNPDTLITSNAITILATQLELNKSVGAIGPKILNTDGTLQLACRRSFPTLASSFFKLGLLSRLFPKSKVFSSYNLTHLDADRPAEIECLSGACMMFRRSLVEEVGELDESTFMHAEDIDYCWRIKEAGYKIMYQPESVIFHEKGSASKMRPFLTAIDLHKGMHWFYKKHLAPHYWPPLNWLVYAAIWTRACLYLSLIFLKKLSAHDRKQSLTNSSRKFC